VSGERRRRRRGEGGGGERGEAGTVRRRLMRRQSISTFLPRVAQLGAQLGGGEAEEEDASLEAA
jgi:hypothetical protein